MRFYPCQCVRGGDRCTADTNEPCSVPLGLDLNSSKVNGPRDIKPLNEGKGTHLPLVDLELSTPSHLERGSIIIVTTVKSVLNEWPDVPLINYLD